MLAPGKRRSSTVGAMARRKTKSGLVYRPSRSVWIVYLAVGAIALGATGAAFALRAEPWVRLGFALFVGAYVVGLVELVIGRLVVDDESVRVRGLRGRKVYDWARIREARIDGILAIRLDDGRWVSMPDWLGRGDTLSARKQIGKRIVE